MPEETGSTSSPPPVAAAASSSAAAAPSSTPGGPSATAGASPAPSTTTTMTVTDTATSQNQPEVLRLTLRGPNNVRWDESVVDNEGLGRKSSKRCCIFHKQRAFGESSTDSSDEDGDGNGNRKIARPKKKVPDYQRFHA